MADYDVTTRPMEDLAFTLREYNGVKIPQRPDGYMNATKLCQAGDKQWSHFRELKATDSYIDALERVLGIPRDLLILSPDTWADIPNDLRGTWVHPRLAARCAQWISPELAVIVDGWVVDILEGRSPVVERPSDSMDDPLIESLRQMMKLRQHQLDQEQRIAALEQAVETDRQNVKTLTDRLERPEPIPQVNPESNGHHQTCPSSSTPEVLTPLRPGVAGREALSKVILHCREQADCTNWFDFHDLAVAEADCDLPRDTMIRLSTSRYSQSPNVGAFYMLERWGRFSFPNGEPITMLALTEVLLELRSTSGNLKG